MDRLAFAILGFTMLVSMLAFGLIVPLLPIYARQFGADSAEVGLIFSITGLVNFVTLPVTGPLSDRLGRRVFLIAGLLLLAVSLYALAWANSVIHLILLRALQGFAMSLHLPVAQAMLGDMTPPGEEGRWMGRLNALMFAGLGFGPLLGGLLHDAAGTGMAFLVAGTTMVASMLMALAWVREPARRHARARGERWHLAVKADRVLVSILLLQVATGLMTALNMAFVPILATEKLALGATAVGLVLAIRTPIAMLQSWSGRFADTHDRKVQIACGCLVAVAAIVSMPGAIGLWTLLLANATLSLGMVMYQPAASAIVLERGRTIGMGTSMSLAFAAMQLGAGIGPVGIGWLMEAHGLAAGFHLAGSILLGATLLFVWLMRGVPARSRAPADEEQAIT